MTQRQVASLSDLNRLPAAIWIPAGGSEPSRAELSFYRGSPLEMVREMASEMEEVSLEAAVGKILMGLAKNRRIAIRIPQGLPDERLSTLFVFALLETGVGREMPKA